MQRHPSFPTQLHQDAAACVKDFFSNVPNVDTVLVVNSCARGHAVPESDLDFAVLVSTDTTRSEIAQIENAWITYSLMQPTLLKYRSSNQFAHLHLDVIDGHYTLPVSEIGVGPDFFEIEIGNQICYSAPMDKAGTYFKTLQKRWLPYYDEELRLQRLNMSRRACEYDLEHIPYFIKRGLYFQAFDTLYKAFQEYLKTLFIANKTYPIAYNKWIKEQVAVWLNKPDLYPRLSPILSLSNFESDEINDKAKILRALLNELPN